MEIRTFAERILWGTRLEDKLLEVGRASELTDRSPGTALKRVEEPGRPRLLSLNDTRARVSFPSLSELENPTQRGHVLHFFANHELLALELMALALLKFPEAPESFRRGLVATMLEEQEHMRLYIEQMEIAGVELGEIPVSRYFWDCIASMNAPLDFVARMSMTFEQANLDYSAYYAQAFKIIGDTATADVLQYVFEDEIKHVRHGVVWFERWRDPELDVFDAYCRLLPSPLNASRARGRNLFHIEARRKAGLSEEFIRRLEVYGASRGRPPAVHLFNPSCESEVAYGAAFTPRADIRALTADLETLPMLLAGEDDLIVVSQLPQHAFLQRLRHAGFRAPEFHQTPEREPVELHHTHLGELRPWGWSPVVQKRLAQLSGKLTDTAAREALAPWTESRKQIYTKSWSAELLRSFSETMDWPQWWSGPTEVGCTVTSLEAVAERCKELADLGHNRAVVKAPWSTSGQGAIRVIDATFATGQEGWIARMIGRQQRLVVEPWLDAIADLSLQLYIPRSGPPQILGMTHFATDARGQYLGTFLTKATWAFPRAVHRWLTDDGRKQGRLPKATKDLATYVSKHLREAGYTGLAGIDMLIYRSDTDGTFRLKPIVEINPRTAMGHIALTLRKRCAPGALGLWSLLRVRDLEALGFASPSAFAEHALAQNPLEVTEGAKPRWKRGVVFTNDPATATQVVSMAVVGASLPACQAIFKDLNLTWPV